MASLKNTPESQYPNILAIGTAKPSKRFHEAKYPNFSFEVSKNTPTFKLKGVNSKKTYNYQPDETINGDPKLKVNRAPSPDGPLKIVAKQIPELGKEAASNAIKEWGRSTSKITHLIFCTSTDLVMSDLAKELADLMGLKQDVHKSMIHQQRCSAAGTAFRQARDWAKENADARVLIVCCDLIVAYWPKDTGLKQHEGSAFFAEGAAAAIVGSNPNAKEHPLFGIVSAKQTSIPDSPNCVADNIQQRYAEAVSPLRITDSNKLFYVVHPNGPEILKEVKMKLGLNNDKLIASQQPASDGKIKRSQSVLVILDEMTKMPKSEPKATTGQGLEWGILFAFGPLVTMETVVLRIYPIVSRSC